ARGQVNDVPVRSSRSLGEIVRANVFTRFNAITGVAFGPGGSTLVSWGRDGTARVWNVEATVDPVRSLCGWAKGAFTTDRWRDDVPPGPAPRALCPAS
ncbi:cation-translocating P-type ATPase, partial [Streptomyces achromogenes]